MQNKNTHTKQDTGSIEIQVVHLNQRISNLSNHLKNNRKDFHSQRTLMILLSKRKRFLNYLKRKKPEKYKELIKLKNNV